MEIPKAYEPQAVETKWYQFWIDNNFFTANPESKKPAYSIVIPPPNVTGVLTLGHVLNNTIQDILARKARMEGKEVLWLPGTDHAGIATQNAVEKALKKSGEIKHRDDLGREAMVAKIWEWKNKYGGIIIQQLKKLGASCDWSRERFTMDPEYSQCVQRVFVDLYKKGLIYRGKRMVNWCPASLTALSDEEVEMKEQRGFLYYFKVQVAETPETFLTIATTRPETIPGDTAVAVNPKDPRYAHLIGKHVIRPLPLEFSSEKKLIPIIGDEHVDFEFGTGVLKVTPAHDMADFDIGTRHNLAVVDIMNPDGTMNDLAGNDLKGLERFKARKVAIEKLTELGSLEKEEPYTNKVGFSERAGVPIEPRLSEQWFLKYPSVEKARNCVDLGSAAAPAAPADASFAGNRGVEREARSTAPEAGAVPKMQFYPQRWAKVYDHWLNGIQDWCISRQLWWGHRVPVWTLTWNSPAASEPNDSQTVRMDFPFLTKEQNQKIAVQVLRPGGTDGTRFLGIGVEPGFQEIEKLIEKNGGKQDTDVLDTWFSSWLWPFATMGWPEKTETLKKFYPTDDLVTGPDIIFFWVARMIMAGFEYMGEMPFKNVYFTGIIRDKQGRKMSKSLGNSPDPLDLIAKYGADALRFGVMRSAPLGQDILFDEQNVELGRNFCNKLWNACRFRQMQGGEVQGEINPQLLTVDDKWILLKLNQAIEEVTHSLAEYRFSDAAQSLYRFFWSEYCDWYVETTKAIFFGTDDARKGNTIAVIDFILSHTLRLFHPFMPFITEELWHGMSYQQDMPMDQGGQTILFAPWPKKLDEDFLGHYGLDDCYLDMAAKRHELVTQGRNLRREANIQSSKKARYVFKPAVYTPPGDIAVLKILLNAEPLDVDENFLPLKGTPVVHSELGDLFLPIEGGIDVAAEKARLTKELEKMEAEIAKVVQKLNNPAFVEKVPAAVLQEHQQRRQDWSLKKEQILASLAALEG